MKKESIMAKKKTLLIVPFVLLFTLIISLITPFCAYAETDDGGFTPRLTAPSSSSPYYSSKLNYYFQTGYGMPNCVAYAYGRIYELNGEKPKFTHGSAGDWYFMNKNAGYYDYGSKPKVGAVACWSHHVAVVERINSDGSITFSESRWQAEYFVVVRYKNPAAHNHQKFYGYIYTYNEKKAKSNAKKSKQEKLGEKIANKKVKKNTCYMQKKADTYSVLVSSAQNKFVVAKLDNAATDNKKDEKIIQNMNLLSDRLGKK